MSTVLILGARSDIAQAAAHRFAREGFDIQLAARGVASLEDAKKDLEIRYGVMAQALEFDALDMYGHASFYEALEPKPDIVLCVFGLLGDQDAARHDLRAARRVVDTNFTGAASILGVAANDFERRGSGTIVGVSSVAGDRGRQSNYLYGSAKAGLSAFLAGLRNRLYKSGVHVATVKPGFVATRMTEGMDLPGALTARPEQAADAIYKAYAKKRNVIYTRWMWRYIMLAIRLIPESLFKRLKL